MATNLFVRNMDLGVPRAGDNRRLEVVVDGLPLFGGAQLAVDTTLVSERVWKKSSEKGESSVGEEKWARPWEHASAGGRAVQETPLHMAKVRSGNRGAEGAADEGARKLGSTVGEGRHRTKPLLPVACLGGTNCVVKLLTEEAETSLILKRPRTAKVTPTEDPRERVKERVQNGSTLRKVREWARDVGQD